MRFSFSSQPIWVSSIAHLIEDERTGHIHMIWQLRDANEIKRQELWLRDQANRDSLTGLYNRANFEHIVTECLRQNAADGTEAAMFMLDVDNFKWINDHLGHDQGDQVLRRVGSTLRSVFRASDVVGALGRGRVCRTDSPMQKPSAYSGARRAGIGAHDADSVAAALDRIPGVSVYPRGRRKF